MRIRIEKQTSVSSFAGSLTLRILACSTSITAMLGTTGCAAVGPDFHRPLSEAPARWSDWHGGDAGLALPDEVQGSLPADIWAVFNDPELEHLIERARAANADLRIARLRFAEARMQESTVAARRGIQVNATADASRRRDSEYGAETRIVDVIGGANTAPILRALGEPYSLYRPGFDASWELDLWGRVRRSEEAARADTDEQAALLRQSQLSLAADVARNYFTMRSSERQLQLLQHELSVAEDEVRLLMAQQAGGLIDESAVIRERQQLADLRSLVPELQSQQAQAINQITQLLGAKPGDLNAELALPASEEFYSALPDLKAGVPSEFAHRRPDIAAAEARLHSATANTGVAVADLYPRITLGASFGLESVGTAKLSAWGARDWSVGPSISLPLFDHGRRTSTITLRKLEQQEAAVSYQQTVLKAWHEVDEAVSGYTADVQHCAQLAEKVRHSEEEMGLAKVRAAKGTTSDLPYLDAQSALSRSQRDLAQGSVQRSVALVALYKALGDGGDAPIATAAQVVNSSTAGGGVTPGTGSTARRR
jgi:NodT family efflux transporter outer membrane factor (OMF) lipoprotein